MPFSPAVGAVVLKSRSRLAVSGSGRGGGLEWTRLVGGSAGSSWLLPLEPGLSGREAYEEVAALGSGWALRSRDFRFVTLRPFLASALGWLVGCRDVCQLAVCLALLSRSVCLRPLDRFRERFSRLELVLRGSWWRSRPCELRLLEWFRLSRRCDWLERWDFRRRDRLADRLLLG